MAFKWGDRIKIKALSGRDRQFSGAMGIIKSNPTPWKFGEIKQCPHKIAGEVFYSVQLDREFPIIGREGKSNIASFCGHELELVENIPELKLVEKQKTIQSGDDLWKDFPGGKPF